VSGRSDVAALSDDGLSRKLWEFNVWGSYLVLTFYAEQTRKTKRHGWKGDFWSSSDERHYHSRLDRPTEIPVWVYEAALKGVSFTVAIGWSHSDHVVATVHVK